MIEELKAWLNREPQAGQAVSILAKHGPALIAAVELAEAVRQMEDLLPEIMTSRKRNISDAEALVLATNMNGISAAKESALAAYRAAKEQKC